MNDDDDARPVVSEPPEETRDGRQQETVENEPDLADFAGPTPLAGLGPALRRLRMHRGMRQYEAARAAGVTKAMLSAYETGKRRPSIRTLDSLLEALEASLGDLHLALVADRREREMRAIERGRPRPRGGGDGERSRRAANEVAESRPGRGEYDLAQGYPSWAPPGRRDWDRRTPGEDLYRALGVRGPLPAAEEHAFAEMLDGFLKLLRYVHRGSDL